MTQPDDPSIELGPPTDVSVDPEDLVGEDDTTPTGSAARYEEGDTKGGTGGLDAGGAG
jgi:hypothetical protein